MQTLRVHIIFRILCFTLAISTLSEIAIYKEQMKYEMIKEISGSSYESIDDNISKHELPSIHIHLFKNSGIVNIISNYSDHFALQYKPEITPPPPKVS